MGTASKVVSVFFRLVQLASAAIVAGLVGRYLSSVHDAHAHAGSRIIYAIVIAGISIIASLVLMIPWKLTFFAFPLDAILFILWMVEFGLLANLTASGGCNSGWYWTHWGYYWGGFWRTVPVGNTSATVVNSYACNRWDSTLAFSFIGGMFWLFSAILGIYNSTKRRRDDRALGTNHSETKHVPVRDSAGTAETSIPERPTRGVEDAL